jgi:hypothetical protein
MSHLRPLGDTAPLAYEAGAPTAAPSLGRASWAADYQSTETRRAIQLVLGLTWLLDAVLQLQPYMFTRAFETQVIEPSGEGNPGFVAGPVRFTAQLMLHSPMAFDALFATVQLAIGLGLLCRRTARAALAGSVIWALAIWWLGEGLGGTFTSSATPITGAPGAAVIYALIAALAWPPRSPTAPAASVAYQSPLGKSAARFAWLALWGSGIYLLLPSNRAAGALRSLIASGTDGEPGWLGAVKHAAAGAIGTHSAAAAIALAVVFAVVALGVFVPAMTRPVLILAVVTAAAIWVLGETVGQVFTGQATDPNSGPLLALLAAAYWPPAHSSHQRSMLQAFAGRGKHRLPRQNSGLDHEMKDPDRSAR